MKDLNIPLLGIISNSLFYLKEIDFSYHIIAIAGEYEAHPSLTTIFFLEGFRANDNKNFGLCFKERKDFIFIINIYLDYLINELKNL